MLSLRANAHSSISTTKIELIVRINVVQMQTLYFVQHQNTYDISVAT